MPTPFIIFLVLAVIAIIVTVAAKLIHHRNRDQRDADEIRLCRACLLQAEGFVKFLTEDLERG